MWFIGQFPNGSWGFQQEGCKPRFTSKHEAEIVKSLYESLKTMCDSAEFMSCWDKMPNDAYYKAKQLLKQIEAE